MSFVKALLTLVSPLVLFTEERRPATLRLSTEKVWLLNEKSSALNFSSISLTPLSVSDFVNSLDGLTPYLVASLFKMKA